ncbi:GGDEF domain-containing protein [Paenibacillus roseipurpureus]|uniref:GGDEF domain-containing protein n=1 Tax=Paenibacillus roseopurpureus TaxID=2918901 RepID=A0AA96LQ25_9BACL|nr:GGDEF domain-containing protein [Paenibacillus sp. MBLB1832]WNR42805.1 GGDEF domain-containing protein [Paenibacillus sp. MBLB1832]
MHLKQLALEDLKLPTDKLLYIHHDALLSAIGSLMVATLLLYTVLIYVFHRRNREIGTIILVQFSSLVILASDAAYRSSTHPASIEALVRLSLSGSLLSILAFHWLTQTIINRPYRFASVFLVFFCTVTFVLIWFGGDSIITSTLKPIETSIHPSMVKGPLYPYLNVILFVIATFIIVNYMRFILSPPAMLHEQWPLAAGFLSIYVSYTFGIWHNFFPLVDISAIGPILLVFFTGIFTGKLTYARYETLIQEKEHLFRQISTDNLTGLYNRSFLMHHLQQAPWAGNSFLIFIDMDNFKYLNDTFGHLTGDAALQELGRILQKNSRKQDIPTRFGGDEFLLLLEDCNENEAIVIAVQILHSYELYIQKYAYDRADIQLGLSIGIVPSCYWEASADRVIHQADEFMYKAKKSGKNRIAIATDKDTFRILPLSS